MTCADDTSCAVAASSVGVAWVGGAEVSEGANETVAGEVLVALAGEGAVDVGASSIRVAWGCVTLIHVVAVKSVTLVSGVASTFDTSCAVTASSIA
jgi:hypothetical protein